MRAKFMGDYKILFLKKKLSNENAIDIEYFFVKENPIRSD